MSSSRLTRAAQSPKRKELRAGIPAVLISAAAELLAVRWLIASSPHPHTVFGILGSGWVSVAVAAWLLGAGIAGWSMATRKDAGLLFLWAMALSSVVTVAAMLVPASNVFGVMGYTALAFLSAVTVHFHVIFPRKMRPWWRRPLLMAAYGIASLLTIAWILFPHRFFHPLGTLSRAFFGMAAITAWARMFYVGRRGSSLEEKWVGRWLSFVLIVGGIVPAWGYLMADAVLGKPVISLHTAFLFEAAIPLGYFVMVERYEPWREDTPASRMAARIAVALIEISLLGWVWAILAALHPDEWFRMGIAAALLILSFPLHRIGWMLLEGRLYGGWYKRDRFLSRFAGALEEETDEKAFWRRAVKMLAEGMKIEEACGESKEGWCTCWRFGVGEEEGRCLEDPEAEIEVSSGDESFGKLLLSPHIEGSGFNGRDMAALNSVGRMLGMKLSSVELQATIERLMKSPRAESKETPNPLSDREIEVLELVAKGLANKEIAERLTISEKTVVHHLEHIYLKLGAQNRAHAVAIAVGNGWVEGRENGKTHSKGA